MLTPYLIAAACLALIAAPAYAALKTPAVAPAPRHRHPAKPRPVVHLSPVPAPPKMRPPVTDPLDPRMPLADVEALLERFAADNSDTQLLVTVA